MLPSTVLTAASRAAPAASIEAEGAVPGDFAALLALDLAAAVPQQAGEAVAPALTVEPAIRQAVLQTGNPAGKILPVTDFPADAAEIEESETSAVAETKPAPRDDAPVVAPFMILANLPALPRDIVVAQQTAEAAPSSGPNYIATPRAPEVYAATKPVATVQTEIAVSTVQIAGAVQIIAPAPADAIVLPEAGHADRGKPTTDQAAVRFLQPAELVGPETAKLVEARNTAQPIADRLPQRAVEIAVQTPRGNAPKAGDRGEPLAAASAAIAIPEVQPAMLVRDLALGVSPQTTRPVTPAADVRAAPHDFATLVDRLVEARDAAGAPAVSAAIAHAEFGRISLRFNHDDGAMSVAMTSADPGFAPAVAAATASAQTATSQQDNGQRPDQSQQHQGNSSSGQTAQGQSQGSTRGGERAGHQTFTRGDDSRSEASADAGEPDNRRRGIYA